MLPRVLADLPVSPALVENARRPRRTAPLAVRTGGQRGERRGDLHLRPSDRGCGPTRSAAGLRVISNFGVGVDHIDVAAAAARGIPVGNTPGILDGATADLAFALLLAAGRRLVEGDRYARGPDFLHYDPSYMLGREVHGSTLGIVGMGRIGDAGRPPGRAPST